MIEGYAARINPKALGLPLAAWLRIRPIPGQLKKVAEILRDIPEVVECDRITGEDCFIARAHVETVEALERLIDELIPLFDDEYVDHPVVSRCAQIAADEGFHRIGLCALL